MKRFERLLIDVPNDLVFGTAPRPVELGFGVEVGGGAVVPEIKYFPLAKNLRDEERAVAAYAKVTRELLHHAANLGIPALVLETELPEVACSNPGWGAAITRRQLELLEHAHEEHGTKLALRVTVADTRDVTKGGLRGDGAAGVLESFRANAEAGAHALSIESFGGKEVLVHALTRGDLAGVIFATGILGTSDVRHLWERVVKVCGNLSIPAGDTACAHANSAMVLAGGKLTRQISHAFAAVVRAVAAVRSLAAYEAGALGPGKDCGYENVVVKAITGFPMSMEGKSSACAHSSLVGNVAMAAADLWSNESVEHVRLFSGPAPNAFLEMLHYDCELLNAAARGGEASRMVDFIVSSNQFTDPQALVLTPASAVRIGGSIVAAGEDPYARSVAAAREALAILSENADHLSLPRVERRYLERMARQLEGLPDNADRFVEDRSAYYEEKLDEYLPKNYGI